jgi:hypothetical protein
MTAKGTISVWAKPSASQVNNFPTLIGGASTAQLEFGFQRLGGTMYYKSGTFFATTYTPDNKWHLFTLTSDGTNAYLYIDGVFKEQVTFNFSSVTSVTFGATNGTAFYTGVLDDVRVYNRMLSAQEVALLYALGTIQTGNTPATNSSFSIDQGGLNGGLVAYWPLDGNTTSWTTDTTKDVSGNNNAGTLVSMSTSTSPMAGKIGGALQFNGSSSYIAIPATPFGAYPTSGSTSSYVLSFSTWFKTASNGVILGQTGACTPPSTCTGFVPAIYVDTSGKVRATMFWHAATTDQIVSTGSYQDNKWHYLVDVYNNGTETLYIDNVAIGSQSFPEASYTPQPYDYFLGTGYATSWPSSPSATWAYFNGSLDDVRIYNRALSAREISDLYSVGQVNVAHSNTATNTGINSGLVGYWTFDGPSINWRTNVVSDMSGKGDAGTLVNMSTSSSPVAGKIGQAMKFNSGSAQEVSLGTAPAPLVFAYNQPFTIALWAKPSASVGSGTFDRLFSIAGSAGTFEYFIMANNNTFSFNVGKNGTGDISVSSAFALGQWYHIVGVYDGTNVTLYINGIKIGSSAYTFGALSSSGGAVTIGGAGGTNTVFNGTIDDVRVYNRVLSIQEVQELYTASR